MLSVEYIAGFFDADGCMSIGKDKRRGTYVPCATFTNSNYDVLTLMQYYLSLCEINTRLRGTKRVSEKYSHVWRILISKQSELVKFCNLIKPHLVVKQEETELMIRFLKCCKIAPQGLVPEKFMLYKQIKSLKKRS